MYHIGCASGGSVNAKSSHDLHLLMQHSCNMGLHYHKADNCRSTSTGSFESTMLQRVVHGDVNSVAWCRRCTDEPKDYCVGQKLHIMLSCPCCQSSLEMLQGRNVLH